MNQQTNGAAKPSPEPLPLDSFSGWPLDKKIIVTALAVVIIGFAGCTARAVQEVAALKPKTIVLAENTVKAAPIALPKPKLHPLEFLPSDITGYRVMARQRMPGADTYAAEGIYEPGDGEEMIQLPRSVYVSVTYYVTAAAAKKSIERQLAGYPRAQTEVLLGDTVAKSGLDAEGGAYVLAWTERGYAIQIDGTFTDYAPANKEDVLQKTTIGVAESIADKAQALVGKAE